MKKFYLVTILVFTFLFSFGQATEVEPNNSFATADVLGNAIETSATVGGADAIDYHKLDFFENGNLYLLIQATNTSTSGSHFLKAELFNGLQTAGNFYSANVANNANVPAGATVYDTIYICGKAIDTFFLSFNSNGTFSYKMQWYFSNAYTNDDPNNSFATAKPFFANIIKEGGIKYEYRGNNNYDTVDYFKSILPAGDYSNFRLYLKAQNNSCINGKAIRHYCYKNNNVVPFASGFVGNDSTINQFGIANNSIPINNMVAGDSLFVKFTATGAFSYELRYTDGTSYDDDEDNCCYYNAISMAENQTVGGNVGEYDFVTNGGEWIDEFDTYRIILPHDGAINVFVKATYVQCSGQNQNQDINFNCEVLGKYGYPHTYKQLIGWYNYPTCNELKYDTIKIRGFAADTFYLRLNANEKVNYNIKYQFIDSTGSDVEPNNNQLQATPIAEGQIKKGHVKFYKDVFNPDNDDYYKATLPADGKIKLYVKATYRDDDNEGQPAPTNYRMEVQSSNNFFSFVPDYATAYNLLGDAVYRDTFNICGVAGGDVYFRISANVPYEYEIKYEVLELSANDNDVEPNNSFLQSTYAASGVTKKGHIGFRDFNVSDVNDYYKMIFTSPDTLKIFTKALYDDCKNTGTIVYRAYKKNSGNVLFQKTKSNILPGQVVLDTMTVFVSTADTVYFEINSVYAIKYEFKTKPRVPVAAFSIIGDSTVCLSTQTYIARNIIDSNITYNWSLPQGGGTITWVDSVATVNWTTTGNRVVALFLTNPVGNSLTRQLGIIVNNSLPTQIPLALAFARTLSTTGIPAGANCQWFRNGVLIAGAIQTTYLAALSGTYTVKFVNDCGEGPASNAFTFAADALVQTINFPHVANITMAPALKVKLNATASSGLPVFYQKISGSATILNDSLLVTGAGIIIVKALQPGNDVYNAAVDLYDTITVIKGNQIISFDSIPNKIYSTIPFPLSKSSNVGLFVDLFSISNNIWLNGSLLNMLGAGEVTVTAYQNGDANYNDAIPVVRTFCIGLRNISPIVGDANPCLATYKYYTPKIPGAVYTWTLSGGGTLTTNNDTAFVQWQTPGSHTLKVKANSSCDPVFSNEQTINITTSNNVPLAISNMQPANNIINQQLPLQLSWIPGGNTVNYDLYVWNAALTQPATPFASNINAITFTLPQNSLAFNTTYKWRVVAKNPCSQTAGPIQQFSLIPLPDLAISDVLAPTTANSGQTITISWKVTNIGPGNTNTNQSWKDAVFLSFDTIPNFTLPPNVGGNWFAADFPVRTKLIVTKPNLTALNNGQNYTNSVTYTLPISLNSPVYAYVITNYQPDANAPLQVTRLNDTARNAQPVVVTLSPTPDLRVDSVFTPFTTFSGSTINVTYKVKNYGVLTPAGASWGDRIFISQSPLFDSATSIKLNSVRWNGSYYPAGEASGSNNTQLLADSFYTKTVQAVIPNFIFGTWFVYVKANSNNTLYEGAFTNNNVNKNQLQVYLTPTPKLTIQNLNVPVTNASTTQPIGVSWNIFNEGVTDNIEKNKGHYFLRRIGNCPFTGYCPYNSVCIGPPAYFDSTAAGSSFWIDRTYLSTDSSGLNIGNAVLVGTFNHGTEFSGYLVRDQSPQSPVFGVGGNSSCNFEGPTNINNVINPSSNFPTSTGFNIPDTLQPGNYYVYVVTNPTKTVFEYPGTLQIKRSALPINIQRPDVVPPLVSVTANVIGAQSFPINYTITNNGPGAVFNHIRRDNIYVSNFPNFDASAQLISTQTFTENLPVGIAVPHSYNYSFAAATTGNKYFYVYTNFDSSFKETNSLNNISVSAATNVTAAIATDLVVSNIILPDTVFTIFGNRIIYTVTNNGPGATTSSFTDSIYFGCNATFNNATNNFVVKKIQSRILAPGASYTDTIYFAIEQFSSFENSCFPLIAHAPAYFYVKTNATNSQYEGSNSNNNVLGSGVRVLKNPLADPIVTQVSSTLDTAIVGRQFPLNYSLKNIGLKPTVNYYNGWYDGIFFSVDSIFNNTDVLAQTLYKSGALNRNETKDYNGGTIVPNIPTGDYYVLVYTNQYNTIIGDIVSNNVNFIRTAAGAAKKIHIIQPLMPDLVDSVLTATASVAVGQQIKFKNRTTNIGVGPNFPYSFTNKLWLSTDFLSTETAGDKFLLAKIQSRIIEPTEFFEDSVFATIPITTVPGNYILKSKVNATGNVFESNNNNNYSFSLLNVYSPPPTDLIVENILKPDTVFLGYTIDTLKWVIKNQSANTATGLSADGVYLSQSMQLDSTATLLGLKNKTLNMAALGMDTVRMAPLVNSVIEGNYNVIVKTDLLNNIVESNKDNNVSVATTPIYVAVKQLPMNVLTPNTLQTNGRYYKLLIPDSLRGSTIKITLKTNDSSLVRNEMYVGANYIPSNARFDYKFEVPNYGNQQIVMTDVYDSLYYIFYKCASPNPPLQNVTLKAEKLPFSILNVNSASGGNIGNVTVKISGSLFRDSMVAKLSNAGTTIYSSAVYFTNSTVVYATFNLAGKPLGLYNVTLTKPDGTTAVMANGFSIVVANNGGLITGGGVNTTPGNGNAPGCDPGAASGLNSQLVVQLVVPNQVVVNWPFTIQINYSNPTNGDIAVQSRILYSELGEKLAFTQSGVASGTTSLYLELVEQGGPPGIIRAGGSGTINVYSKSPPVLTNGFRRQEGNFRLQ